MLLKGAQLKVWWQKHAYGLMIGALIGAFSAGGAVFWWSQQPHLNQQQAQQQAQQQWQEAFEQWQQSLSQAQVALQVQVMQLALLQQDSERITPWAQRWSEVQLDPGQWPELLKTYADLQAFVNHTLNQEQTLEKYAQHHQFLEQVTPNQRPIAPGEKVRLSSGFGKRKDPIHGQTRFHSGLDLAGPIGTPILSAAAGVVVHAQERGGYGWMVEIRHSPQWSTRYAHMNQVHVKVGQKVAVNERIGDLGSSGRSTGPHLHFEVLSFGEAIDPRSVLNK